NSQSVTGGRIHAIASCAWDERTVTAKTQPRIDGPVLATLGAVALGERVEFDVTPAVSGDGLFCFALESPSADGVRYNSREAGAVRSVDAGPSVKRTFFRIRVSGVGSRRVASARLQLQVANLLNAESVLGGTIHAITACGWDEHVLTWNSQPSIDGPVLAG